MAPTACAGKRLQRLAEYSARTHPPRFEIGPVMDKLTEPSSREDYWKTPRFMPEEGA